MNIDILEKAFQKTKTVFPVAKPSCTIILGSGWGNVMDVVNSRQTLNYHDIPGLGMPTVEGHSGRLFISESAGLQILVFQGRRHWFEGSGWEPIAIPVYISQKFGVSMLILTNAAGGINKKIRPGNLMIIDDHINAMGSNPLIGNNDSIWGPRFADQTHVYDPALRKMLDQAGNKTGTPLTHGVYAATSGPTYETPAEYNALRLIGADAVGMSTVPEAILGNAAGMRVAGISCITNTASHTGSGAFSHKKVIDIAANAQPAIRVLLAEFLKEVVTNVFHIQNHT
ncbi:MAG: purine-nucleoside phosphorylase [Kiritimatiellae bacterium]|nr:purine-nucleoside phosphorylase [Kiritimatiellia bacterium]MDD5522284.1 purine-nucleoside phosphorylase [Kiritimatiellia bacterium]